MGLRTVRECACVCVYMHVCQEGKKCCMLVLDEAGKDSALILQKKKVSSQRFIALEKSSLMGLCPAEGIERCLFQQ